jgi:hypothetical protein
MSASVRDRHLFISEAGPTGTCEICGERFAHDNHKEFWGPNSRDMYDVAEDDRIDLIAVEVRKGKIVGVLLEAGIGKVERYIDKLAKRHPDVRLISRDRGPSPLIEIVKFGPKVDA